MQLTRGRLLMVTGASGHSLHGSACLIYFVCFLFLPLIAVRPKWHYNMQKRHCWRWLCTVCSKQEHAVQCSGLCWAELCSALLHFVWHSEPPPSPSESWCHDQLPAARDTQNITSITTISYELKICRYFPIWAHEGHISTALPCLYLCLDKICVIA